MKVQPDVKLDFSDVLILPKRNTLKSRSEVQLEVNYNFKWSKFDWKGVPIIAANMDTVGTFEMAIALAKHKMMTAIHKFYSLEEWIKFDQSCPDIIPFVCISTGISLIDIEKTSAILNEIKELNMICMDVANGYSEAFIESVQEMRKRFPDKIILAGNVVTSEMTEALILAGADIVKIGIGPGSVCTTRKKAGVGYPQLSAILECSEAAHRLGGRIISDGGCSCPGDVSKAFGAGSDFVMLGGMLAGHEECAGQVIEKFGKKYKEFYGMSSKTAMEKYRGNVADYRTSEGKVVQVPYKGLVDVTIKDILGGLRSCCTYVGSQKLQDLAVHTTFIQVRQQTNEIFQSFNV